MAASVVSAGNLKGSLTQLRPLLGHVAVEYDAFLSETDAEPQHS